MECNCGGDEKGNSYSSPYKMISVSEALGLIKDQLKSIKLNKSFKSIVNLKNHPKGSGLLLAEDLYADFDHPHFNASVMDGYAVSENKKFYKVIGSMTCASDINNFSLLQEDQVKYRNNQQNENENDYGLAVYITTGAPVPKGAIAVQMVEKAFPVDEYGKDLHIHEWNRKKNQDYHNPQYIRLSEQVKEGQFIRPSGCDIAKGQMVLREGSVIGGNELGVITSVCKGPIKVYENPKIGIFSSGDEVKDRMENENFSDNLLADGKNSFIFDSNRPMLISLIKNILPHAEVIDLGIIKDQMDSIRSIFESAMDESSSLYSLSAIICSGGVSMGSLDLLKPILSSLGQIHFGRINMKPGKPTTFATIKRKSNDNSLMVFALPGNPVSASVTFNLFAAPALKYLAGFDIGQSHSWPIMFAINKQDIPADKDRPEYHRVNIIFDQKLSDYVAVSTGNQMSSRLLSACSNGLLLIPSGSGVVPAGRRVACLLVDSLKHFSGDNYEAIANTSNLQTPNHSHSHQNHSHHSHHHHHHHDHTTNKHEHSQDDNTSRPIDANAHAHDIVNSSNHQVSVAAPKNVTQRYEIGVCVLTISDRCSQGLAEDKSGPTAVSLLNTFSDTNPSIKFKVMGLGLVADSVNDIQNLIKYWSDSSQPPHIIITTGGTGFSSRDVTPEAVSPLFHRTASGIVIAAMNASLKKTPLGALSRPVAGTRFKSLIVTLPGSPKAVNEIMEVLLPILPHAAKLMWD